MAASDCQQNNISRLGRLNLLHQKVVDLAPPYSQCYGTAIWYTKVLSLQALTRAEFCWSAVPANKSTGMVMATQWITQTQVVY